MDKSARTSISWEIVPEKSWRQSSRARRSMGSRFFASLERKAEQLEADSVISAMETFTVAEMISGSVFRWLSGMDATVEAHSSGYSVSWHVELYVGVSE